MQKKFFFFLLAFSSSGLLFFSRFCVSASFLLAFLLSFFISFFPANSAVYIFLPFSSRQVHNLKNYDPKIMILPRFGTPRS